MRAAPGTTMPEKLGASAGAWAAGWLALHYVILRSAAADPMLPAPEYVRALVGERMTWEWATALRVMGGIMIIWFMGSLAGRLRLAEGEPGRLASITFGIGVVWGAIFLLSAMFNSVGIVLATTYQDPASARLTGILGREILLTLSPSIVFTLTLATGFVALRYGGFPSWYGYATAVLNVLLLALTVTDWYGPGNLGPIIMMLSLSWLAITSLLIVPAPKMV